MSAFDGTGLALDAIGPAQFSLSGLASIAAGAKSKTVTGVSLRPGSLVLATVQNNAGVSVAYVVPNVSLSKITINLDKVVPSGKTAKVGWFVVNSAGYSPARPGWRLLGMSAEGMPTSERGGLRPDAVTSAYSDRAIHLDGGSK